MISTGIEYLDRLTGGLKLGDNVVWQVSDGVPVEHFVRSFFADKEDFLGNIIYINFNYSPLTIYKRYNYLFNRGAILIDAFSHGKGNSDQVFLDFYKDDKSTDAERFRCIENPKNITSFVSVLNEVEMNCKDGAFYIFDSLTGMNELWKDESAVLDFFTFTCPKLYDLNTLAYWMLEREAHSKGFIAGIMHITQIVFSINSSKSDHFRLTIKKLEDRTSLYGSEPNYFKIIGQDVIFKDKKEDETRIGEKVKELRKINRITQSELASSLNLTPGAVSQIENDIISPSLQTLLQISHIFKKPIDYFIGKLPVEESQGFLISHKRTRLTSSHRNVEVYRMIDAGDTEIKPHLVVVKGNKPVTGPILLHKGKEFITVVEGTLKLTINGEESVLEEGSSILITSSFIDKYQNGAEGECRFYYILL